MIPTKRANQNPRAGRNAYPRVRTWLPLGNQQKAALCILAREAFEAVHRRAPASQAEFDAWRRDQQQRAIGESSLTLAKQSDFSRLQAHFLDLKGESGRAFNALMKPAVTDTAQARAVLARELRKAGLAEEYAASICQRKHKCALAEATPKQLWDLVFTVRNRAAKARRTEAESDNPF